MSSSGFSIRTTIFSVFLALSLWLYVSLRSSYDVVTTVPLEFVVPYNRSVETIVPSDIRVKIRATGWHLINILYLNAQSSCVIDVTAAASTIVHVGTQDLQQGFRSPVPATVVEVLTDEFDVQLGIVGQKKVPVLSRLRFECAAGYMIVRDAEFTPDSVTLRGNVKVLAGIQSWPTRERLVREVNADVAGYIALSDSLRSILSIEPRTVRYKAGVQRSADIEIEDVPVLVRGVPEDGINHLLAPMQVTVTLRGGIDDIETLTKNDISVVVDYDMLRRDSTGMITPVVTAPAAIRVLGIRPEILMHTIPHGESADREKAEKRRRN